MRLGRDLGREQGGEGMGNRKEGRLGDWGVGLGME